MVYRQTGSNIWFTDFRFNGKRIRQSTKQTSQKAAKTFASLLMTQLSMGVGESTKPILLRDFAPIFLRFVHASRLATKTKEYYSNGWRLLMTQPIAGTRIRSITTADAATVSVPHSGSNVNNALRTLRRMLSLACEKGLIHKVPRIALAEEFERKAVISNAVDLLIITKASLTLRGVYILVADCGIRPADCAALHWRDVDFAKGVIFIAGGKTGKKAQRWMPMTERVRTMLIERAALSSTWVFAGTRNPAVPIEPSTIASRWSSFKRKNQIPQDIVLYSARHTFATDLTEATGNLTKTQKALGHTNLSTTARYNHTQSADIATIMDARNAARTHALWPETRPN